MYKKLHFNIFIIIIINKLYYYSFKKKNIIKILKKSIKIIRLFNN